MHFFYHSTVFEEAHLLLVVPPLINVTDLIGSPQRD